MEKSKLSLYYLEFLSACPGYTGVPASDVRARGGEEQCSFADEIFQAEAKNTLSPEAMVCVANHKLWCKECKQKGR